MQAKYNSEQQRRRIDPTLSHVTLAALATASSSPAPERSIDDPLADFMHEPAVKHAPGFLKVVHLCPLHLLVLEGHCYAWQTESVSY